MSTRSMTPVEIAALLEHAVVGHLGLINNGQPYIIPLHFLYMNSKIYLHSKKNCLKIDILCRNDNVCFEVEELLGIRTAVTPCKYTSNYRSIIASGTARFVDHSEKKLTIMNEFAKKYSKGTSFDNIPLSAIGKIEVIEITVCVITGKVSETECNIIDNSVL